MIKHIADVAILLSTYNGSLVLEEQLRSIAEQSCGNWQLFVRDDDSSDDSLAILYRFKAAFPNKVTICENISGNLGAVQSFARLLEAVDAPYIMFCDQDDVWLPGKIEKTLERMLALEVSIGSETPALVHTDLKVVDSELRLIAPSFWRFASLGPVRSVTVSRLLMQNCVTGTTVMINKALRDAALPIPDGGTMHDWWLALVAMLLGRVEAIDEPLVLYRQHGTNAVGAKRWRGHLREISTTVRHRVAIRSQQAALLLDRFSGRLDVSTRELLNAVVGLSTGNFFSVRRTLYKYGLFTADPVKNFLYLLFS